MRILVATRETQGQRDNDFFFCEEGEPVKIGFACDRDGDNPDGPCGCRRGFAGVQSSRATTTAKVEERALNLDEYREILTDSYRREGWLVDKPAREFERSVISVAEIRSRADELLRVAARYVNGTILERREEIVPRIRTG